MAANPAGITAVVLTDQDWGCDFDKYTFPELREDIKLCHVKVSDLRKIALKLTEKVLDTSWMTSLDVGPQNAYRFTANETAQLLVQVFEEASGKNEIVSEFGELMVSMGAGRALEASFQHNPLPIAELWKPQKKQNEGFDFHTCCMSDFVNFGEAKFSSNMNAHGSALEQIMRFVDEEKHLRDYVHLVNLSSPASIVNLNSQVFGVVAAFSINSKNPLNIFQNALAKAYELIDSGRATVVYLVGVSCEG